jgi:hypothetical protein
MLTKGANAPAFWLGPRALHPSHGASFGRMLIGLVLIGVLAWLLVRLSRNFARKGRRSGQRTAGTARFTFAARARKSSRSGREKPRPRRR